MTSLAISSPALEGTKAVLPGTVLLFVFSSDVFGCIGNSLE